MVRTRAQRGQPLTGNRSQGIRKSAPQKRRRLRDPDPTDTPQDQAGSDQSKVPSSPTDGPRKRKDRQISVDSKHQKPLPAVADPPKHTSDEHTRKRRRTSLDQQDPSHPSLRSARNSPPIARPLEPPAVPNLPVSPAPAPVPEEATSGDTDERQYIIDYWRREGSWPRKYFEQDDYTRKDFDKLMDSTTRVQTLLFSCYDPVARLRFAEKDAPPSLSRKRSGSNSSTPTSMPPPSTPSPSTTMASSEWRPREEKSAPYRSVQYQSVLETKGSYMKTSPLGITDESRNLCRTLLDTEQPAPKNTLFDDDIFESVCESLANKNEATVFLDILRLIVPSAVHYALRAKHLEHLNYLTESVNEGWNRCFPLTGIRPQPDYSVGFQRDAFTQDQIDKLMPFTGDMGYRSLFKATYHMYFPFLTCEMKCGAAALDIADRQNAHSMTLAVRAIVELFRIVKREDEVNRQILAFSVSHDHQSVRIYGHYPVITDKDTKYYRHPIRKFDFTDLDGKEKWTAYRFIKNVYDIWVPDQFKRICSAIDQLLVPDSGVSLPSEATGLSQDVGNMLQLEQPTATPSQDVGNPVQSEQSMATPSQNVGNLPQSEQPTATPDPSLTRPKAAKRRKGQVKT
ncbi:hypothetical protein GE21DRAFT_9475 [Neurospora crassa]|uniref:DUF7924 domain-containing protein n=2 Tax=Neurospora crassa TaxID=5141 RepID=Q7RYF1_NEUCR|nr:hypothetical protein NCU05130 [Neurospora crassa OR74A]EAA27880.3 hypothetical protein NCU05130 [Neurospora crassa OR74A]KHE88000.1 hypothetical protein GE21DRAFT_9475 [Neurospora crassa]CAD70537.1 hypothetical protein [Neurospora crassa]|eukprot:XP_957116.3 hypothetical protein NCU05130 [Neurospora crassa OR74A]